MNVGMMWFDNDPKKALETKITQAADYYRKKYGLVADTCMVPVKMVAGQVGQIKVLPDRSVLPGHLWIGVEEK